MNFDCLVVSSNNWRVLTMLCYMPEWLRYALRLSPIRLCVSIGKVLHILCIHMHTYEPQDSQQTTNKHSPLVRERHKTRFWFPYVLHPYTKLYAEHSSAKRRACRHSDQTTVFYCCSLAAVIKTCSCSCSIVLSCHSSGHNFCDSANSCIKFNWRKWVSDTLRHHLRCVIIRCMYNVWCISARLSVFCLLAAVLLVCCLRMTEAGRKYLHRNSQNNLIESPKTLISSLPSNGNTEYAAHSFRRLSAVQSAYAMRKQMPAESWMRFDGRQMLSESVQL